jgi:hypothetical protein
VYRLKVKERIKLALPKLVDDENDNAYIDLKSFNVFPRAYGLFKPVFANEVLNEIIMM